MRRAIYLLTLVLTALSSQGQCADSLRQKLEAMRRLDDQIADVGEKAPRLEEMLAAMLQPLGETGPAGLNDAELRDLYDAAYLAAFYSRTPSSAEAMQRALQELERRKIAPATATDDLVAVLVAARLFAQAQAYYAAHRGGITQAPPAFEDLTPLTARPTYLAVSADGASLQRREFHWSDGPQVLVIGAPDCHFSRLATQAIEDDAPLAALMRQYASWMLPQQIVRDMRAIATWNQQHPLARLGLIYRSTEWSFLQSPATPTFYFFRDGKLVESFSGWPGAQQKQRVRSALRAIGIDTAAASAAQ